VSPCERVPGAGAAQRARRTGGGWATRLREALERVVWVVADGVALLCLAVLALRDVQLLPRHPKKGVLDVARIGRREPPRDAAVLDQAVGRQKRVDLHTGKRVKHSFRAPKSRKGTGSHGGSECLVVVQHDNVPKVDKV
jgi:hypothetical protein